MFPILAAFKSLPTTEDGATLTPELGAGAGCCGAGAGAGSTAVCACAGSGPSVRSGSSGCCGGRAGASQPAADMVADARVRMPLPPTLQAWVPLPKFFRGTSSSGVAVQWFTPTTLAALTALQTQFASASPGTVKCVHCLP